MKQALRCIDCHKEFYGFPDYHYRCIECYITYMQICKEGEGKRMSNKIDSRLKEARKAHRKLPVKIANINHLSTHACFQESSPLIVPPKGLIYPQAWPESLR